MEQKLTLIEKVTAYFQDGSWIDHIQPLLLNIGLALVIYIVGTWIAGQLCNALSKIMLARKFDIELQQFLDGITRTALKFVVIIVAVNQLGVDTTSLLALFGAAGLAVGLALKDSLSNFASGVMLILTKPFRVGNFIEAAGVMGNVEKITVFNTVIGTTDNKEILIPNAQIHQGTIINYSAKATRRVDLLIGISYGDSIKTARDIMQAIISQDNRILKTPIHTIAVDQLGESSVNFVVRVWVNSADYWEVKWDLLEKIKTTFDEQGISIPFPQSDVHLYSIPQAMKWHS